MQKWKQNKTKKDHTRARWQGGPAFTFFLCGITSLSQGRIAKGNNKSQITWVTNFVNNSALVPASRAKNNILTRSHFPNPRRTAARQYYFVPLIFYSVEVTENEATLNTWQTSIQNNKLQTGREYTSEARVDQWYEQGLKTSVNEIRNVLPLNCYTQGYPTTVFSKISVRRNKYCLEFSITMAKNF